MVDTVRSWPEYREMLETLQEMFVDVQSTYEHFRELYMRGNILNNWKRDRNSPWLFSHT
jgi:hypothetical protein